MVILNKKEITVCAVILAVIVVLFIAYSIAFPKKDYFGQHSKLWDGVTGSGGLDYIIAKWGEPEDSYSENGHSVLVYPGYTFHGIHLISVTDEVFFIKSFGFGIGTDRQTIEEVGQRYKIAYNPGRLTIIIDGVWYDLRFVDGKVSQIDIYRYGAV